jgi:ABC-2 type transport system permease protein
MKVLAIAGMNLRRTLRERTSLFFIFLFPMLLILVLGLAFGGAGSPRVGVVVGDGDPLAGALWQRVRTAGGVDATRVADEARLVAAVERGELEAGLAIPAGYGAAVRAGRQVRLHYVSRSGKQGQQVGQIVSAAVDQESGRLRAIWFTQRETGVGFDAAAGRVAAVAGHPPAVSVDARTTGQAAFPQTLGRFDVGASSQLLLFVFLTALTSSAALIETRRLGLSRRMYATPTTAGTIVAGEALGRLAVSVLQGLVIMAGAAVFFGVNWGDPIAAGLLMVVFALVAGGAGLLLGAAARTPQQSLAVGLLLSLGLGALGGTMLPLDLFPPTMRTLAHATPHAWAVDGYARLVRHGGHLLDIAPQLGVLCAAAAPLFAAAAGWLRRAVTRSSS